MSSINKVLLVLCALCACGKREDTVVFTPNEASRDDLFTAAAYINGSLGCNVVKIQSESGGYRVVKVEYNYEKVKEMAAELEDPMLLGFYDQASESIKYFVPGYWKKNIGVLVLMHEIGHALGLMGHEEEGIMEASIGYPMPYDKAANSLKDTLEKHGFKYCMEYNQ